MKKALILYDSVYGNTKKIAMSLSRGLEAGAVLVDSRSIQDIDISELKNYDVIGIGGPTHFHGASKYMKSFLSKLKHVRLESKAGFAFETKADFWLAGSAAKKIIRHLKKMRIKLIHPTITGIVLDKEGPLEDSTSNTMEQIGIKISEKLNNRIQKNEINQKFNGIYQSNARLYLSQSKWVILVGGPLFFFIRAIYMASTGGDCFGTINPSVSWFLLLSEIFISGLAGIAGLVGVILFLRTNNKKYLLKRLKISKIVLFGGISALIVHLMRVAIWILLCVI